MFGDIGYLAYYDVILAFLNNDTKQSCQTLNSLAVSPHLWLHVHGIDHVSQQGDCLTV